MMTRQERDLIALLITVFDAEIVEWDPPKRVSSFATVQQELYDAEGKLRLVSIEQQNAEFARRAQVQRVARKKSVREIPGQVAWTGDDTMEADSDRE